MLTHTLSRPRGYNTTQERSHRAPGSLGPRHRGYCTRRPLYQGLTAIHAGISRNERCVMLMHMILKHASWPLPALALPATTACKRRLRRGACEYTPQAAQARPRMRRVAGSTKIADANNCKSAPQCWTPSHGLACIKKRRVSDGGTRTATDERPTSHTTEAAKIEQRQRAQSIQQSSKCKEWPWRRHRRYCTMGTAAAGGDGDGHGDRWQDVYVTALERASERA